MRILLRIGFLLGLKIQDLIPISHRYIGLPQLSMTNVNSKTNLEIRKKIVRGEAHERLAYFFNGVAGHSGFFTTAPDLIRFMRILLN